MAASFVTSSLRIGHIATAMLPLCNNELTERCHHFGLTFVMKHPLKLRTEVEPLKGREGLISHNDRILLLGSCFSDNIGSRLEADLFDTVVNPFGALYNPRSIHLAIQRLAERNPVTPEELFQHNGLWHSFYFHSAFSSPSPANALEKMNKSLIRGAERLHNATVIIITLGSARGFTLKKGIVVANCHKMPAGTFDEFEMDSCEVDHAVNSAIDTLRSVNKEAKIIFTVSPIRHTGYGMHENALSKAALLLGLHRVIKKHPQSAVYFPAFEIMMDDLRDYRFYADDMKHPSTVAVNYIYDIFLESFTTADTRATALDCRNLTRRMNHRPLSTSPESISAEIDARRKMKENFLRTYPVTGQALEEYIANHQVLEL